MKKISIALGSFVLGLGIALPVGVFADDIKSLVGTKITGEYTVSVNGVRITDPAIVAAGKSHAPVRALADALGAKEINVDNTEKTIDITVGSVQETNVIEPETTTPSTETTIPSSNEYASMSKVEVKKKRDYLSNSVIPQTETAIERYEKELENPIPLVDTEYIKSKLSGAKEDLIKYQTALAQMNEALGE
ncbi:hypothetical protein [Paenibacillus sp. M2]|uniref:hypothetical protein n=1 Tax=Paenibacillus sp. M2 TaxID=3341793 RepID=UPI00398A05C0